MFRSGDWELENQSLSTNRSGSIFDVCERPVQVGTKSYPVHVEGEHSVRLIALFLFLSSVATNIRRHIWTCLWLRYLCLPVRWWDAGPQDWPEQERFRDPRLRAYHTQSGAIFSRLLCYVCLWAVLELHRLCYAYDGIFYDRVSRYVSLLSC